MRGSRRVEGENSEIVLRSVWVYVKVGEHWQWVFGQSSRLPQRPQAAAVDPRLYESYVGQYAISAGRTFTVIREGETLLAQTTGRETGELIPKSDTEFIWFNPEVNVDAQASFVKDEGGQVTQVVFRVNGQEAWRAKKLK